MESGPSQEGRKLEIKKTDVIESIKSKGVSNPETISMITAWTLQEEARVARENTSRATIVFNIERADLYVAAGDIQGALECLEDARLQAHNENETDLYQQILTKMDEIEGRV